MKLGIYIILWTFLNIIMCFMGFGVSIISVGIMAIPSLFIIIIINIIMLVYFLNILNQKYNIEDKLVNNSFIQSLC
jgi:hypothetical protein